MHIVPWIFRGETPFRVVIFVRKQEISIIFLSLRIFRTEFSNSIAALSPAGGNYGIMRCKATRSWSGNDLKMGLIGNSMKTTRKMLLSGIAALTVAVAVADSAAVAASTAPASSAASSNLVAAASSAALGECARIFEAEMCDGVIHGATVMAGGLDGDAVSGSWGWADAAHTIPMTPRTVIDIASVTKAAAGTTAFLVAHAKGLVDFDAPFTNYLSAYRAPLARVVTVRDLMNHLSGFGEADGTGKRVYFSEDPVKMLDNILSLPPAEPKKGAVAYSCRNYVLLGRMLEQIAGCGVDEFARREIFLPAGMADSSLGAPLPSVARDRLAQTIGTPRPGEISDFVARPLWGAGIGTVNAGMFSTAEDLARLLRTYLRGGVTDGGVRIFGAAEMSAIAPSATNRVEGARSFGWQTASADLPDALFGTALFHSGWSGQTVLFDLKRRRYAIVLTTRCGDYSRAKRERLAAIAALLLRP